MMKKQYTFALLLVLSISLHAQITVTNATFPVAGDTLKYATDLSPTGVEITPPGGPTTWDFSGLGADVNSETVFKAASEGSAAADFPLADLMTISLGGQNETYYNVTATSFENLGFFGVDPTGVLPIPNTFRFDPPVVDRWAPMHFIDTNNPTSNLSIAFSLDDLGPLADSLGPIAGLADSLRIRGVFDRLEIVDAFGSLKIPGGTYDVLRQKRTEYRETRLDIHTFIGWQDITDLIIGGAGGGGFGNGLGKDTVVTYLFFSDTEKEIIAEVNAGSDGTVPQSVTFKDNGDVSDANDQPAVLLEVVASPNPANGQVVFSLKNLSPAKYALRMYNTQGQMTLTQQLTETETTIGLAGIATGTYFYQVADAQNKVVATGKLSIVNQ